MWDRPLVQELVGGQLHMQHGPIDLVLKAWGKERQVDAAYRAAALRFEMLLGELVSELPVLRRPVSGQHAVSTPVARRMVQACLPFMEHVITPMAAVAGAVADELLAVMCEVGELDKAFVNDGGDIAVHLAEGQALDIGVMGDFSRSRVPIASAALHLKAEQPVRGIATSGAQGRSFSLGIADSVTVLAANAALADAAATLVANAVNLDHPRIVRRRASDLDPDSDLGARLVTVLVPPLSKQETTQALEQGLEFAEDLVRRGLITDAALSLQGQTLTLGVWPLLETGTRKWL